MPPRGLVKPRRFSFIFKKPLVYGKMPDTAVLDLGHFRMQGIKNVVIFKRHHDAWDRENQTPLVSQPSTAKLLRFLFISLPTPRQRKNGLGRNFLYTDPLTANLDEFARSKPGKSSMYAHLPHR